jgi:hypothetical protein
VEKEILISFLEKHELFTISLKLLAFTKKPTNAQLILSANES